MRTTEQIDAEIARLKEERKKAVAAEREEAAKGEAVAKEKIGSLVLGFYRDGWRACDPEKLASALREHPELFTERKPLPVAEATREWKAFNARKKTHAGLAEKRTSGSGSANATTRASPATP